MGSEGRPATPPEAREGEEVRQYEIWWAGLPDPVGRRPVLILTRTAALRYLSRVTVAEITTRIRGNRIEVRLDRDEGMPRACVANLDSIHAVPSQSLSARIGTLASSRHVEVKRALGQAFEWIELTGP